MPLLLSSGGPGACDYLEPIANMVAGQTAVLRWEQRGCGRSSHHPPYDLATCLQDMEAIRQTYGYEKWLVGGHSWGANLSLAYTLAYPHRVHTLLYLAGTGLTNAWKPAYRQARAQRGETQPTFTYEGNLDVNRAGNASWNSYIQDATLIQQLHHCHLPTLILCGTADIRPNWPSRTLADHLPNATYHTINDAPHYLWLTHAGALKTTLQQFLQTIFPYPQ